MNERLTPAREAEIEQRTDAATPGPWLVEMEQCDCSDGLCGHGTYASAVYANDERRNEFEDFTDSDWLFIIHAREDVPALLAELAAVRAERDAFRDQRNNVFATNEQLHDKVTEAFEARLRAENETRTVKRETEALRARAAELENALAAAGRSLSSFIFDSDDPGADALGAQWLYHQAMPQADDPFAQPRAFRSSVFSEAAKTVEEMDGRPSDGEYSREYLNGYSHALEDAAERLEKRADQAAEGSEAVS
ncbi:hypothetical protein ELQ39_27860 [Streptomyces sp. GB4-14]|uniref:hypothetical protein n=1 Tax=Streptomyces sp. GB4-14 TaxID=2498703 RepID=UPI001F5E76D5|nr:hypothetical protein [Streptomyces sp. GB4-14]